MSIKLYHSIAAEEGSSETYKTISSKIQSKAKELDAVCTVNSRKQTITVVADNISFVQQAILDFNGNVIVNGAIDSKGNPVFNEKIQPFNTNSYDFQQLQQSINENFGPYVLIKVGLNGDIPLLKALTADFDNNAKQSLLRDIKVIGEIADSPQVKDNIEKCETLLAPENKDAELTQLPPNLDTFR